MAGIGTVLGGFGNAYPQYMQDQQSQEMNKMKLQQALTQMQNDQAARTAQTQALGGLQHLQGQGPGGTITPQQLAGLTQNPDAFATLNMAIRPANAGMFNLEGRNVTGQYGLDRSQMVGDNAMQRVQAQQEGANQRNAASNDVRKDIVNTQQQNANQRNAATNASKKSGSQDITKTPEYKVTKAEYDEAKKDERNIEAHYPLVSQAYNDPQWQDARRRSMAAQGKLEKFHAEQQAAPAQGPTQIKTDDDFNKLPSGTTFIDPEGTIRVKP